MRTMMLASGPLGNVANAELPPRRHRAHHADRRVKLRLYQRLQVPEYWIVDVDARLIERWRPEDERPEILAEQLEWRPDLAYPALVIDLPAYFREVTGE